MNIIINLLLIYLFVLIGFIAKLIFKDQIQERSFIIIYIYFLMPIIMIWGILSKPLQGDLFMVSAYFLLILIVGYILTFTLSYFILNDPKDKAIATITGLIGNTGNMGIPLGLAIYGIESVAYTAMINLVNSIFVMVIGAYTYSRGSYSFKQSIINVCKLPMIWASVMAFAIHVLNIHISEDFFHFLEMGAYTGLVLQLIIFGMFLAAVSWHNSYPKLASITLTAKFLILPALAFVCIHFFQLRPFYAQILMLQTLVPVAINNVNLAALYHCDPHKVAWVSFISFILASLTIPVGMLLF
ncbi:MAG: AEC family transporter [Candidatus Margulisiibacteriota bacterium]